MTVDTARAGQGQVNLAVDDLTAAVRQLAARGVVTEATVNANKGVTFCPIEDPDGNVVSLLGNFRVHY